MNNPGHRFALRNDFQEDLLHHFPRDQGEADQSVDLPSGPSWKQESHLLSSSPQESLLVIMTVQRKSGVDSQSRCWIHKQKHWIITYLQHTQILSFACILTAMSVGNMKKPLQLVRLIWTRSVVFLHMFESP